MINYILYSISSHSNFLVTRLGLGVHLTFPISCDLLSPSHLDSCPIACARLLADVLRPAVLSSSLRAAGVNRPACVRGVAGDASPEVSRRLLGNESFEVPGVPESSDALARKDREAVEESL